MQKKFIYLIAGLIIFFIGLILFIILITAKPVAKVINPLDDAIAFTSQTPDGQSFYYYNLNYKLMKWNLKTKTAETWIEFPFQNFRLDNISYSPDKNLAIVYWSNLEDSTDENTILVDLINKTKKDISKDINNSAWSPDSKQLAVQRWDSKQNQFEIDICQPDGTRLKKIANDPVGDINILWTNQNTLIYFPILTEANQTNIKNINLETNQETTLLNNIIPTDAKTITGQNQFILSLQDNQGNNIINVYDLTTKKSQSIENNNLSIDKIVQISNTNDFLAAFRPTNQKTDDVVKINASTGKITSVRKKMPFSVDATNLEVSADGKFLYFISNTDLYKLKL